VGWEVVRRLLLQEGTVVILERWRELQEKVRSFDSTTATKKKN
jgi:hypothetical protein